MTTNIARLIQAAFDSADIAPSDTPISIFEEGYRAALASAPALPVAMTDETPEDLPTLLEKEIVRTVSLDLLHQRAATEIRRLRAALYSQPATMPEWEDPRVQMAYGILCDTETEPPQGEHWEGFAARRIVAALAAQAAPKVLEAKAQPCSTCNDSGAVGHPPDSYFPCPECAPSPEAKAQAVPEGWRLVPVEPTDAMEVAGGIALENSSAHDVIGPLVDAWSAMLAAAPQPAPSEQHTQAAADVLAERQRQISAEGWTPEHDDEHHPGALPHAAGMYAIYGNVSYYGPGNPPDDWPWDASWWKPAANHRRNLVKAGALILAEIERMDRDGIRSTGGDHDA